MVAVTVSNAGAPPNLANASLGSFTRKDLQWKSVNYTIQVKNGRSKTKKKVGIDKINNV